MKRTLTAVALATGMILAFPALASAGVETVGWFTRSPAASAPEGGLQVANAPDGVVSYGAISVTEDGDSITSATLTLKEEGRNVNASGAKLQACPAAGSFTAGKRDLKAGPKADCVIGTVDLERSAEGVWTADVTSVLQGDSPAVAIVPAEGTTLFQVSFAPPTLDVVADNSGPGSDAGIDSSFDAGEFGGSSGSGGGSGGQGSSSGGGFDDSSGSGSTFDDSGSSGSSGSSGGSFDSGSGGPFGSSSSFDPVPEPAPTGLVAQDGSTLATDSSATPGPELAGGTDLPTRQRLAGTAAGTSSSDNSGQQFAFFVLVAAVIGAGAGFGRNRLVTSRA